MALTENDLDQFEQIVEEKVSHLPTKDELYSKMAEVMGELKGIREEQEAMTHRLIGHEDRITDLEDIHPAGKHATS